MIRNLMASTAVLALLTTGALAQQQPADQTQQPQAQQPAQPPAGGEQQQAQPPEGVQETQQQGEILAEDLMGKTVYSGQTEDAESVGDISDLVLDEQGEIKAVVIGVGGFLGIGQKNVAINFEELQFSQDQDGEMRVAINATQEQLEAAPEFEETDQTRLYGGLSEEERQTARTPEQQAEQDQQAAEQQEPPEQQAAEQQPPAGEQPEQQMAEQPDQQAQPDQQVQPDQQMAEQPDQQAQPDQQMAEQPDQQAGQLGEVAFIESPESGETRATKWIGQQIVTAEDEEIGEVQDILVDETGMTEAVVVDVSGFVESEKQVAVPFDTIQVEQQEGQEDVRLVASLTKEELEQAPAFQPEQATAEGQDQQAQQDQQMAQQPDQQDQQMAQQPDQQESTAGEAQERQAARAPGVEQTVAGVSADQLMGANVIGGNDEEIGQVGDVIFSQDGQIRAVLVDVGGFLGIGAKEVAIQFDAAQVQRQDGQELALMIPATKEQLEQAPEYQETAELQQQGGQEAQQPAGQQQPEARPEQPATDQPAQQ